MNNPTQILSKALKNIPIEEPGVYEHFCSVCKKHTLQKVTKVNLLRGVKLLCLKCGVEGSRYRKLIFLNTDVRRFKQ